MGSLFASMFDDLFKGIWTASLALLQAAFGLIDAVTVLPPLVGDNGAVVNPSLLAVWPLMRWLSLAIALGLFFWQLGLTMLRGGRGFFQLVTAPISYGIALAATVGGVSLLLGAADALAQGVLAAGFDGATTYAQLLSNPKFGNNIFTDTGQTALNGVSAIVLALVAIFGVIPAALGYGVEMIFRTAAILVLIATSPVTAAGLLAQTTASWFWRSLRWILAAVAMKPALALTLVLGVSMMANPQGIGGLLAGVGTLLVALLCPFVLFRLLAFVDPATEAGQSSRAWASTALGSLAGSTASAGGSGEGEAGNGTASAESANTSRFDTAGSAAGAAGSAGGAVGMWGMAAVTAAAGAVAGKAGEYMNATGVGSPGGGQQGRGSWPQWSSSPSGSGGDPNGDGGESSTPPPDGPPDARKDLDQDPVRIGNRTKLNLDLDITTTPRPGGGGGGDTPPGGGGAGGAGAAGAAGDVPVVVA